VVRVEFLQLSPHVWIRPFELRIKYDMKKLTNNPPQDTQIEKPKPKKLPIKQIAKAWLTFKPRVPLSFIVAARKAVRKKFESYE